MIALFDCRVNNSGGYSLSPDMILQADDKSLITGFIYNGGTADLVLLRFNTDGSLDTTFGANGAAVYDSGGNDNGWAITLQPDGKAIVAGYGFDTFTGLTNLLLVRFNVDGTLDTTFGTNGAAVYGSVSSEPDLILQADGKILVGSSIYNSVTVDLVLLRFNADGSLDTTFGTNGAAVYNIGGYGKNEGIALHADGKVLITYYTYNVDLVLVRFNADGSLDTTFGTPSVAVHSTGNYDTGFDVTLQSDGKALIVYYIGNGVTVDLVLSRFNTDGSLDATFGTNGIAVYDSGGDDYCFDVTLQSDGKAIVAGNVNWQNLLLVRFNTNGTLDTTFGTNGAAVNGSADGVAVKLQSDGKALVLGWVSNPLYQVDWRLFRYK